MRLCHESIYQVVYQPNSRFMRPSRLAPHRRSPLRTGRDHRRATSASSAGGRGSGGQCSPSTTGPSRRSTGEAGHWEGDLIIGNNHLSAIGTLVERQTRMLRLVHLHRSDSDSLHAALVARMQDLPPALMRSITWDQGTEMARHLATTDKLGAPVYFCDSRSPWQRGRRQTRLLNSDISTLRGESLHPARLSTSSATRNTKPGHAVKPTSTPKPLETRSAQVKSPRNQGSLGSP
jgi:IS30 family transposase